jgi:hypothetical protein
VLSTKHIYRGKQHGIRRILHALSIKYIHREDPQDSNGLGTSQMKHVERGCTRSQEETRTRGRTSQPSETDSCTSRLTRTESRYDVTRGKMREKLFSHFGRKKTEITKKIGRIGNAKVGSISYKEQDSSTPYKVKKRGVEDEGTE